MLVSRLLHICQVLMSLGWCTVWRLEIRKRGLVLLNLLVRVLLRLLYSLIGAADPMVNLLKLYSLLLRSLIKVLHRDFIGILMSHLYSLFWRRNMNWLKFNESLLRGPCIDMFHLFLVILCLSCLLVIFFLFIL